MANDKHYLLVCTVGGTPEPIVATARHWKPARVLLVHSTATKMIAEVVARAPDLLQPGAWDMVELYDAEDLGDCVRRMRVMDEQIVAWGRKGPQYEVVVDFTGGTKCMSAALTLVARRWPCALSYMGGTERTRDGTGTVVPGKEQTRVTQNPWNALGYQAIEDACLLFDQHAFMPAVDLLTQARNAADDGSIKRRLSTWGQLCEGYGLWDRFQHEGALQKIADVLKNAADLQVALGSNRSETVIRNIRKHQRVLQEIVDQPHSRATVADLLASARRRKHEGRHDDGGARLYRALEAIAQLALAERHGISSTNSVALEQVPGSLRASWAPRAENGRLRLGLQDAFALLGALGDQIGRSFRDLGLDDPQRSPLAARNRSILAHGFQPVGDAIFDKLWDSAMKLGRFKEEDLPAFPQLATPRATSA